MPRGHRRRKEIVCVSRSIDSSVDVKRNIARMHWDQKTQEDLSYGLDVIESDVSESRWVHTLGTQDMRKTRGTEEVECQVVHRKVPGDTRRSSERGINFVSMYRERRREVWTHAVYIFKRKKYD
jgi:hypothetical protein